MANPMPRYIPRYYLLGLLLCECLAQSVGAPLLGAIRPPTYRGRYSHRVTGCAGALLHVLNNQALQTGLHDAP